MLGVTRSAGLAVEPFDAGVAEVHLVVAAVGVLSPDLDECVVGILAEPAEDGLGGRGCLVEELDRLVVDLHAVAVASVDGAVLDGLDGVLEVLDLAEEVGVGTAGRERLLQVVDVVLRGLDVRFKAIRKRPVGVLYSVFQDLHVVLDSLEVDEGVRGNVFFDGLDDVLAALNGLSEVVEICTFGRTVVISAHV